MIPQELVKKIRQIQIYTRKNVTASFAGQYESVFRGRGMQFDQVREYIPGDDIRSIDWNVTARTGRPHIKQFVEEREMTVLFAVDLSASGQFGTISRTKNELTAEFCAVLSFAAAKNNDKIGLIIFTDTIELYIPPKKGSRHVLRLIRELLYFKPRQKQTDIVSAMDYLAKVLHKRATVFLVSDFMTDIAALKKPMALLNKRHDMIAVPVCDRAELELPNIGIAEFTDAETGRTMTVDTSSRKFRRIYQHNSRQRLDKLENILRSTGIDHIAISTDKPYMQDLVQFFHMRHRRQ